MDDVAYYVLCYMRLVLVVWLTLRYVRHSLYSMLMVEKYAVTEDARRGVGSDRRSPPANRGKQ